MKLLHSFILVDFLHAARDCWDYGIGYCSQSLCIRKKHIFREFLTFCLPEDPIRFEFVRNYLLTCVNFNQMVTRDIRVIRNQEEFVRTGQRIRHISRSTVRETITIAVIQVFIRPSDLNSSHLIIKMMTRRAPGATLLTKTSGMNIATFQNALGRHLVGTRRNHRAIRETRAQPEIISTVKSGTLMSHTFQISAHWIVITISAVTQDSFILVHLFTKWDSHEL